jgi:hypothetical protein
MLSLSIKEIGKIHPLAKTNTVNQKDINRIPTRLNLAPGLDPLGRILYIAFLFP